MRDTRRPETPFSRISVSTKVMIGFFVLILLMVVSGMQSYTIFLSLESHIQEKFDIESLSVDADMSLADDSRIIALQVLQKMNTYKKILVVNSLIVLLLSVGIGMFVSRSVAKER